MEAPAIPMSEEVIELTRWEDEEIDLLAFELWQRACCPETETDQDLAEPAVARHASCL
jgi:hypothetical protein